MNRQLTRFVWAFFLAALLVLAFPFAAKAGVPGQIGPYRVDLTTEPAVIPVGKVRLTIKVTDGSGKPVDGAEVRALVKMPSMDMGEKETTAIAQPGQPGVYATDANFMMAGAFEATLTITGSQGVGNGKVALSTGQNTATSSGGGLSLMGLLPWIIVLALAAFVVYRLRRTGQRVDTRALLNRGTISGIAMLVVMLLISLYAIGHWRREGAMTPIEAQAMQMDTPAPPGTASVTLASVEEGPIQSTVRYTGQAVAYNEQNITARTTGWINWMPYYVGQRVGAGQLIARLDTSQSGPQVAQQQAAVAMAEQAVAVARDEYRQAMAEAHQAHHEADQRRGATQEANANIQAARDDRTAADADVVAAQSRLDDAQAQLQAAQADQQYWQQEIPREQSLFKAGAVSKDELQRETAQAAASDAKVRQAKAGVSTAQAQLRSAQAAVRKADANIAAASSKKAQVSDELGSHTAHISAAQAAADAARQRIAQAQAGVLQAEAQLSGATASRNYSELRALSGGVITQRFVSPGQLVNPGQPVLKIAQLAPIRLQANVAEADLARIRVGARVAVSTTSDSRSPVTAVVTSITPAVDPVARTGVVEAIVPNRDTRFVPGQYVVMDIAVGQRSANTLRIPTAAISTRAEPSDGVLPDSTASTVWVADPVTGEDGQYTVKPVTVQTGASDGTYTQIVSGLQAGQQVVTSGFDYLKPGDTVAAANAPAPSTAQASAGDSSMPGKAMGNKAVDGASSATVQITEQGFTPTSVTLKAGAPAHLTFLRKTDATCAKDVVMPDYGVKKSLPLNQPVVVEFTPRKGEFTFSCGMNMLKGKVVAQ